MGHCGQLIFYYTRIVSIGFLNIIRYYCKDPVIDPETQQPRGCTKELQKAKIDCYPAPEIICDDIKYDGETVGFQREVPCKYT